MGYSTRRQARLPVLLVALLISGLSASGRVLQQSGGNTAQQLVSDGSDASTPQTPGTSPAADAPNPDSSTDTSADAAEAPASQIRLRWANQVQALPPAYQEAGAGVLNDILGPSGAQDMSTSPEPAATPSPAAIAVQADTNSSAATPASSSSPAGDAVVITTPASPPADPQATLASPPAVLTLVPLQTPAAVVSPTPAQVAATLSPAIAPDAAEPLVPLLGGGLAPDQAPAPAPAPILSADCSDNGSNNQMGLNICRFMTGLLPQSTRTRMCGRYLPRCSAPTPAPAPAQAEGSAGSTAAQTPAETPAAAPAPAPAQDAGTTGSTTAPAPAAPAASSGGMASLLQPLMAGLENIFGGSSSGNSTSGSSPMSGLMGLFG